MLDFLEQSFSTFFNMSVTGSCIILAIILIRLLLRKAPKIFSYSLWIAAGLRLICPFSFSSILSVFNLFSVPVQISPVGNEAIVQNTAGGETAIPDAAAGMPPAQTVVQPLLPSVFAQGGINPLQVVMAVVSALWAAGVIAMAGYGVYSLFKVYRRVEYATKLEGNVFECEKVTSPFVFGVFRPKIYLPCGMDEKQREYVILHEKNHIRRFDHIIKLLSFAVLMLHWYNPLVWVGYNLMIHDMEMSCDEKVLSSLGEAEKKSYGLTLVAVGANRRFAAGAPLSFGENGVEKRIVNILKYKKPKVIAIVLCVIVCIAAAVVCLTNPTEKGGRPTRLENKIAVFIEEDWQRRNSETEALNNNVEAAGVKVISDDGTTVYGWQSLYSYSAYYYELLKGDDNLLGYSPMKTFAFEAKLNENGDVVSVTNYEEEIPDFLGNKEEYEVPVFEHAKKRAKAKYDELYDEIKVYPTDNFKMQNNTEALDGLEATGMEIVRDPSGGLWLVVRFKNSGEAGYIDDDFELSRDGAPIAPAYSLPETENIFIMGGGNESLWLGELNMFFDTVEEGHYTAKLFAANEAEYEEIAVEFDITDSNPMRFQKPELTVDSLYSVYMFADEKIEDAVKGTIYPKSNMHDGIVLNEESLKKLVKHINKSEFIGTGGFSYSPEDAYVVRIETAQGRKYEMSVLFGRAEDTSRYLSYEIDNVELFKILEGIETEARSNYSATEETSVVENSESDRKPVAKAVVSNMISSIPEEINLEIMGMNVDDNYIMLTFRNRSNGFAWSVDDTVFQKEINGEWTELEPIRDNIVYEAAPIYPGSVWSLYYSVGKYLDNIESGKYRLNFAVYTGTEETANLEMRFDAAVEFDVLLQTVTPAQAGEKIENPVMAEASPSTSGVHHVKSYFGKEELQRIKELYNSFIWNPIQGQSSPVGLNGEQNAMMQYSYYTLTVIDGDKEFFAFVYSNGTVSFNNVYYDAGDSGVEMYNLLASGFMR